MLMDEIGRGTSTYDGLSLAWACAENLANKIKALTLFATHYFELTQLPEKMEGVANVHLDALEHGDTIAFMHSVQDGAASKSYGRRSPRWRGAERGDQRARQKLRELESISPNAAATRSTARRCRYSPPRKRPRLRLRRWRILIRTPDPASGAGVDLPSEKPV